MRLAGKIAAGIVIFAVVAAVAVLLSAGPLLNGTIKERILRSANSRRGTNLVLGTIRYNFFTNRISCDSLRLTVKDDEDADDSISVAADALSCSDVHWLGILLGKGLSCGDIAVEGMRGHISSPAVPRTEKETHQEKNQEGRQDQEQLLPIAAGHLTAGGGPLFRVTHSRGGASRDSVNQFTAELRDVYLGSLSTDDLRHLLAEGRVEFQASGAGIQIPGSHYEVGFASLRISASESLVLVDSLSIKPSVSDNAFFAASKLRSTRYRAFLGRLAAHGVNVAGLMEGKQYAVHAIRISRPHVSIVVDMRKQPESDPVQMPNEIVAGMHEKLRIDSLVASGATIEYAELYPYSSTPAVLKWTGVRLTATGISNERRGHDSSFVRIEASAMFQDTARMKVTMHLPLSVKDFTLECRGTLDSLPLPALNSFLEIAERTRIISGEADSVRFAFSAANGRSLGTVVPLYHDLKIAMLAKQSGRSDGISQKLGSFIANQFKIKESNMPEGTNPPKEGHVQYVRKPGDPFFKFIWFSLRGGLGNVVGF